MQQPIALNNPTPPEQALSTAKITPEQLDELKTRLQAGEEIWVIKPNEQVIRPYKLLFYNGLIQYEWIEGRGTHRRILDTKFETFAIIPPPNLKEAGNPETFTYIKEKTAEQIEKTTKLHPLNGSHLLLFNEIKTKYPNNFPQMYVQHGLNGTPSQIIVEGVGKIFYMNGTEKKSIDISSRENWYLTEESFKLFEILEQEIVREKKEWIEKNRISSDYTPQKKKIIGARTQVFHKTIRRR